ncbi:MAG TPA: hypothetical protein VFP86_03240, partial [bacterium]|nr:hypothetical protein [bacterium]
NPAAREARGNLIGAVRRFLRPNLPLLAAGVVIGALAGATSFQPLLFGFMLVGWVAGYLVWRKRRLGWLPPGAAAVYAHARVWRDLSVVTAIFLAACRRVRPPR